MKFLATRADHRRIPFIILNTIDINFNQQKLFQTDGRTVTINAWGRDDLAETSGEYALNISTKTLKFFEDYYDEDYPLTKCDMVIISLILCI